MSELLDELEREARKLDRQEQLELAQRLLAVQPDDGRRFSVLDWPKYRSGQWRSATEVEEYLRRERDQWDTHGW